MNKLTVSILKFAGLFAVCFLVLYLVTATVGSFLMWENRFNMTLWSNIGRFFLISFTFFTSLPLFIVCTSYTQSEG